MRIQNTWLGDAPRLAMLETVIDVIERDGLLERSKDAGDEIMRGLYRLCVSIKFSNLLVIVQIKKARRTVHAPQFQC